MKYHFTVTSVEGEAGSTRMWSVNKTLKKAERIAENNTAYMSEAKTFPYIVIEKYAYDMGSIPAEQIQWYINDEIKLIPIKQPEFAKHTCNFGYH